MLEALESLLATMVLTTKEDLQLPKSIQEFRVQNSRIVVKAFLEYKVPSCDKAIHINVATFKFKLVTIKSNEVGQMSIKALIFAALFLVTFFKCGLSAALAGASRNIH